MSIYTTLKQEANKDYAKQTQVWFKTGKGQYSEHDIFIGLRVPQIRKIAKDYKELSLTEVEKLLQSDIHEYRYTALHILLLQYKNNKEAVIKLYLQNLKYVNNWDLVDTSAEMLGAYLQEKNNTAMLNNLAISKNLWERRIAIIATYHYIKQGDCKKTIEIATLLLNDKEDLMHKAVGWMLREVGKKDLALLEAFLQKHKSMPRTTLRYAIERFSQEKRKAYLAR